MKIFRKLPNFLGRVTDKKPMSGYQDNEFNVWLREKKRANRDFIICMTSTKKLIVNSEL